MEFAINAKQLRAAMKEIEAAEQNGFMYCEAIFKVGYGIPKANYSDLSEKAHPTDDSLNWGRMQRVSKTHRFVSGKLTPIRGTR